MFIEMIRPIFIDSVQFMWELIFTWRLSLPERIDWWLSTISDSTTGDLAKKGSLVGVFTAFIFYFKSPHTTTNNKCFSPVSELGDVQLMPIKLAALNVLEVQRPCLPKQKKDLTLVQGSLLCPPQDLILRLFSVNTPLWWIRSQQTLT